MTTHRVLASIALAAGVLAAIARDPHPSGDARAEAQRLATAIAQERDHVTALELAQWIRDRKPHLRILDLRSEPEFASFHIPRSERLAIESISTLAVDPRATLVLISDGGAHAAQAWVLLQTLGHRDVFFLRGGVGEWADEILQPKKPSDLTRYFGGMRRGDGDAPASFSTIRRRGC